MNWLTKLIFIVIFLSFFSCNDKEEDTIKLQPNTKVGALFVDTFSVKAYTVAIDSTFSGKGDVFTHLVGTFDDPILGKMLASSYAEVLLPDLELDFGDSSIYSSCEIHLKLDYYYGEDKNCTVLINKVGNPLDKEQYYTFDNGSVGENIGSFSINPSADLDKNIEFPISNVFGAALFNQSAEGALLNQTNFKEFLNGISLQPQNGNSILGFSTEESFIRINYRKDTVNHYYDFYFNDKGTHFNHVVSDRSGTVVENLKNREQLDYKDISSGSVYLQASSRLNVKLDFSSLEKFLDNQKISIYRAELEITADPLADFPTPEALHVYSSTQNNNELFNDYLAVNGEGNHFVELNDGKYTFDITTYLQRVSSDLLNLNLNDFMISVSPNGGRVDRMKVENIEKDIKIKIYYTELK